MSRKVDGLLSCPAPLAHDDIVQLAHGGGGTLTARLIETLFAPAFRNEHLDALGDGAVVPVGGKTGTGDNRYEMYGPGGKVIASRVINRTATFVFLIGDRYYGTVTAFVPGEKAAEYGFTSSLPVQIFRELAPVFRALLEDTEPPDLVAAIGDRPIPRPPVLVGPELPPELR